MWWDARRRFLRVLRLPCLLCLLRKECLVKRTFPKKLKSTLLSVGIGVAIFCLFAYSLMLLSVTQSIALKGGSIVTTRR